jgi:hypothetical protein
MRDVLKMPWPERAAYERHLEAEHVRARRLADSSLARLQEAVFRTGVSFTLRGEQLGPDRPLTRQEEDALTGWCGPHPTFSKDIP